MVMGNLPAVSSCDFRDSKKSRPSEFEVTKKIQIMINNNYYNYNIIIMIMNDSNNNMIN